MRRLFIFFGLMVVSAAIALANQSLPATSEPQISSDCDPQRCPFFTPRSCDNASPCYCFEVFGGGGNCVDDFFCSNPTCSDGLCPDACPICYINTCCGVPTCGPDEPCTGVVRNCPGQIPQGDGPTAGGN